MNLHVTADKYLIPKLSAVASDKFCSVANACKEVDDVFDIIEACRNELNHNDVYVKLADALHDKHLLTLLGNDRFRAQLDSGGKEALWQQLDELIANGVVKGKRERSYILCPEHSQDVFRGPLVAKDATGICSFCDSMSRYRYLSQQPAQKVWMDK